MQAEEIKTVLITLPSGEETEQVILREKETGLLFCMDASYVEQEAGEIHSPFGHGVLTLPDDEVPTDEGETNTASEGPDFTSPIKSREQAETFLKALSKGGYDYCFDDDPDTIMKGHSGDRLFTDEQASHMRQRLAEMNTLDWGEHDDAQGYLLDIENPGWRVA